MFVLASGSFQPQLVPEAVRPVICAGSQDSSWLAPLREAGVLAALLKRATAAADGDDELAALGCTWAALHVLSRCRLPAREQQAIMRAAAEQVPHLLKPHSAYRCSTISLQKHW